MRIRNLITLLVFYIISPYCGASYADYELFSSTPEGLFELGKMYEIGGFLEKDMIENSGKYEKIIDGYVGGDKIHQDYDKAYYYFSKSAKGGSLSAKAKLGDFYANGYGSIQKDEKKAFEILKGLSLRGHDYGRFYFARLMISSDDESIKDPAKGRGVINDLAEEGFYFAIKEKIRIAREDKAAEEARIERERLERERREAAEKAREKQKKLDEQRKKAAEEARIERERLEEERKEKERLQQEEIERQMIVDNFLERKEAHRKSVLSKGYGWGDIKVGMTFNEVLEINDDCIINNLSFHSGYTPERQIRNERYEVFLPCNWSSSKYMKLLFDRTNMLINITVSFGKFEYGWDDSRFFEVRDIVSSKYRLTSQPSGGLEALFEKEISDSIDEVFDDGWVSIKVVRDAGRTVYKDSDNVVDNVSKKFTDSELNDKARKLFELFLNYSDSLSKGSYGDSIINQNKMREEYF